MPLPADPRRRGKDRHGRSRALKQDRLRTAGASPLSIGRLGSWGLELDPTLSPHLGPLSD